MVAVIDYDAGNIRSVEKAVAFLKRECIVTRNPDEIGRADHVILPGVGAFGDAMGRLRQYGLEDTIKHVIEKGVPFMGICLGLQLLFEESEEDPGVKGLCVFEGKIRRFPDDPSLKVPNIGWNSLEIKKRGALLQGIPDDAFMYFVHSYYASAKDRDIVSAQIEYTASADVVVERENVFACQFHPEKSSSEGLKILENFLAFG